MHGYCVCHRTKRIAFFALDFPKSLQAHSTDQQEPKCCYLTAGHGIHRQILSYCTIYSSQCTLHRIYTFSIFFIIHFYIRFHFYDLYCNCLFCRFKDFIFYFLQRNQPLTIPYSFVKSQEVVLAFHCIRQIQLGSEQKQGTILILHDCKGRKIKKCYLGVSFSKLVNKQHLFIKCLASLFNSYNNTSVLPINI